MQYQWDNRKAKSNLQKHGVEFADAVSIFADDFAITVEDDDPIRAIYYDGIGRIRPGTGFSLYLVRGGYSNYLRS